MHDNAMAARNKQEEALVRELGDRIGYGRTMQLCEQLWRERLEPDGMAGGEHTTGPCAALLVPCPCVEDYRTGKRGGASGSPCDWCCGALRVTKRVAEAMAQARGR